MPLLKTHRWTVGVLIAGALVGIRCSADGNSENDIDAGDSDPFDTGGDGGSDNDGGDTDSSDTECEDCQTQLEQYGITWYFDAPYRVGRFANGDFWVLGPVTIVRIAPDFDGSLNGWEVNPKYSTSQQNPFLGEQGFDSRIPVFNSELIPTLPYVAEAGQSVVKALGFVGAPGENKNCHNGFEHYCLTTAAVLTVVGTVPPGLGTAVFRPPYVGTKKPLFELNALNTGLLPNLPRIVEAPALDWIKERYQRVQMNHEPGNTGRCISPIENFDPPHRYGPNIGIHNAEAALALFLDDALDAKMPALINYVQTGIDWIYAIEQGKSWTVGGPGIQPGFKLPAVLAATLLSNPDLKTIVREAVFPERTYIQPHATLTDRALFGIVDLYSPDPERRYWQYLIDKDAGLNVSTEAFKDPYGHIDGELPEFGYAVEIFPSPWKGSALAAILMPEMLPIWNNPLFFDYIERNRTVGRWTQPDPCAPHDGNIEHYGTVFGPDGSGGCIPDTDPSNGIGRYPQHHGTHRDPPTGGGYISTFIDAMWDHYR